MKKKGIILSLIGIVLISSLLVIIITKKENKTVMLDGAMLALTLDGKAITSFPEKGEYSVDITCQNGNGKWMPDEWKIAIEDISGNVTCNVDFKSTPSKLISVVETTNANNNYDGNGYRYSGRTPNNYVWFNNELWRIIGSIPTKQLDGTTTNLVKIIKNTSIGSLAYDAKESDYNGAWGSNTLYTLLNAHYYATSESNLNATNTDYCYGFGAATKVNCDYRTNGILSSSYFGNMIKNVYWNTGASRCQMVVSDIFEAETAKQTVSGYVGLMSVSDYGYAASSEYHGTPTHEYMGDAASNNWLYNYGLEWTNIQAVINENSTNRIYFYGAIEGYQSYRGYAVRPVVYLDSSVYIASGNGTIENPYLIAMN